MQDLDNKAALNPAANIEQTTILEEDESNHDEANTFDASQVHLELNDDNVDQIQSATTENSQQSGPSETGGGQNQRLKKGIQR